MAVWLNAQLIVFVNCSGLWLKFILEKLKTLNILCELKIFFIMKVVNWWRSDVYNLPNHKTNHTYWIPNYTLQRTQWYVLMEIWILVGTDMKIWWIELLNWIVLYTLTINLASFFPQNKFYVKFTLPFSHDFIYSIYKFHSNSC